MPLGIILNALAIIIGGLIGAFLSNRLTKNFEEKITMIFGCCSLGMGVVSIILMVNMPAVILSIILGTVIGITFHLEQLINKAGALMQGFISNYTGLKTTQLDKQQFNAQLLTVIVLFCASGTGIYGSLVSSLSGDHTILIAKSILDLFTALIFACSLGSVVSLIAFPQFIIFMLFFCLGRFIIPLTTPDMINDFKACGGFLMLATGFRIIRVKMFPIADMIPAMLIVMPLSFYWSTYFVPLLENYL